MYDYTKRINEISDIRTAARVECERLRRILGEHYVAIVDETDDEAGPLVASYRTLKDRIEAASSALERMIRIDERQDEIRAEMKTLQKELEDLESGRGMEGVYESVGSAAFRLFREHPLVDATYSGAFSSIAKYQDDIRRIETQIQQLQSDPNASGGSFFNKVSRGGKDFILRNRRSVKENQLPGLLQKLGRDLAETDFFDAMDDQELTDAAEPLRAAEQRKEELRGAIQTLTAESRTLVDEFNELSGGRRLQKAQQSHEDEIAAARSELNTVLLALGSIAERTAPAELAADVEKLAAEEKRRQHFDALFERLQAGRQAQLLQGEIDQDTARSEQIDNEIAALKEKKKALADEMKRKAAERDRLFETRGDESDLFDT